MLSFVVDQVEHIILAFSKNSNSKIDSKAIVEQLLEQYNSKAERVGLKHFIVSMITHHSTNNMECYTISVQREVSCVLASTRGGTSE